MSHSLLRLAPLSLSLSLVACATDDAGSAEPISSQESAMAQGATEGAVLAMAPLTSNNPATIAAAYQASFSANGTSCATVETDNASYVKVTFACSGSLATTGSIHLELESPQTFQATADLTVGGVSFDGSLLVTVPAIPSTERTFEGQITIMGPRRSLTAEVAAGWTSSGTCVTYSASGSVAAEGPRGSASSTFDIDAKTLCQ